MSLFADVIIPAFQGPYLLYLFFPLACIIVLASEVAVFKLLNWQENFMGIVVLVFCANLVSTVVGFLITALLPTGYDPTLKPGSMYSTYAYLSFFVAFILSVLFEYPIVRFSSKILRIHRPLLTVILANVASYILLVTVIFLAPLFH